MCYNQGLGTELLGLLVLTEEGQGGFLDHTEDTLKVLLFLNVVNGLRKKSRSVSNTWKMGFSGSWNGISKAAKVEKFRGSRGIRYLGVTEKYSLGKEIPFCCCPQDSLGLGAHSCLCISFCALCWNALLALMKNHPLHGCFFLIQVSVLMFPPQRSLSCLILYSLTALFCILSSQHLS